MTTKYKSVLMLAGVLVIGIILGALITGTVRHARGDSIHRMVPEMQFLRAMEKIIRPDDKQRAAIESILKANSEKVARIQQQREREVMAVFDSSLNALKNVLTDEQLKRLEEHMDRTKNIFIDRIIERLDHLLHLTEEQKEKIKNLYSDFEEGRKEPNDWRRGRPGDFMQRRKQMEQIDTELEKILTPEQKEKFNEFRKNRPEPYDDRSMFAPPPPDDE